MLAEERLDLAVEATRLGPGEAVIVITKMGKEVARGTVQEGTPNGSIRVMVSDQGDSGVQQSRYYNPALYSFIPQEAETEDEGGSEPMLGDDPQEPPLTELPLDDRVEVKFKSMGISLVEQPAGAGTDQTLGGNGKPPMTKAAGQVDKGQGPPKSKDKAPDPRVDPSEPAASVNIDALPPDLKKKIIGVKGLDESQRDKVLSEISDAALRALREVGVKNNEIFKTITKIQDAVIPVLEQKGE